jgi:hypothetical protein
MKTLALEQISAVSGGLNLDVHWGYRDGYVPVTERGLTPGYVGKSLLNNAKWGLIYGGAAALGIRAVSDIADDRVDARLRELGIDPAGKK